MSNEKPTAVPTPDIGKEKKKKRKARRIIRRVIVTLLILALLAGAGFYAWSRLKAEYTVNYEAYNTTTGSISNALSFSGTIQTVNSQTVYAKGSPDVRAVYVREGDPVKKGTRLAKLSNGQTPEAEIDGTVNQVYYATGDTVAADDAVAQIVDFTHMTVSIRVDEYDIGDVHVGDDCRITTTATEKTFESTIASIDYVSSSGGSVAYYTAKAYVDVDEGCYPGMQVTVTVPKEEATDVVILKADAISFDENNKAFVYLRDEEDQVTRQYIATGVSNGNYVEITEGLASGDTVYAEMKVDTTTAGLFAGLFGGRNFFGGGMQMPGGNRNFGGGNGGYNMNNGNGGNNRTNNGGTGGNRSGN